MYNIVHLSIIYKYIFDIIVYLLWRELTMVDLLVYTNHRMGVCIITQGQQDRTEDRDREQGQGTHIFKIQSALLLFSFCDLLLFFSNHYLSVISSSQINVERIPGVDFFTKALPRTKYDQFNHSSLTLTSRKKNDLKNENCNNG